MVLNTSVDQFLDSEYIQRSLIILIACVKFMNAKSLIFLLDNVKKMKFNPEIITNKKDLILQTHKDDRVRLGRL